VGSGEWSGVEPATYGGEAACLAGKQSVSAATDGHTAAATASALLAVDSRRPVLSVISRMGRVGLRCRRNDADEPEQLRWMSQVVGVLLRLCQSC